jgi:hypothetical protein
MASIRRPPRRPDGVDVQADLQGSIEYKRHLLKVFASASIEAATKVIAAARSAPCELRPAVFFRA